MTNPVIKEGDSIIFTKIPSYEEDITQDKDYKIYAESSGSLYLLDDCGAERCGPLISGAYEYKIVGTSEEVGHALQADVVNKPKHYQLFHKDDIEGDFIEVKHIVKAVLDRWEEQQEISMSFNQAGCYKEMLQYLLRAPAKNNIQDVEKAGYYLREILDEW